MVNHKNTEKKLKKILDKKTEKNIEEEKVSLKLF